MRYPSCTNKLHSPPQRRGGHSPVRQRSHSPVRMLQHQHNHSVHHNHSHNHNHKLNYNARRHSSPVRVQHHRYLQRPGYSRVAHMHNRRLRSPSPKQTVSPVRAAHVRAHMQRHYQHSPSPLRQRTYNRMRMRSQSPTRSQSPQPRVRNVSPSRMASAVSTSAPHIPAGLVCK